MDDYEEFEWLILALEKDLDRRWEEYLLERAEKQKQQLQPEKSPGKSINTDHHNARRSRNKARTTAPEREMPAEMREHITTHKGGRDIKLVIQKNLCKSDLSRSNNRFSIPIAQIKNAFLTWEEDEFLGKRNGKGKVNELRVTLATVCDETVVSFRRWEMEKKKNGRSSSSYVLVASWMGVVKRNGFRVGDNVQLWSFRAGDELNFAMVVVHRDGESDGVGDEDEAKDSE